MIVNRDRYIPVMPGGGSPPGGIPGGGCIGPDSAREPVGGAGGGGCIGVRTPAKISEDINGSFHFTNSGCTKYM